MKRTLRRVIVLAALLGATGLGSAMANTARHAHPVRPTRTARARSGGEDGRPQATLLFARAGVPYPAPRIYLRAFKAEAEFELWAGGPAGRLHHIKTYAICASSGRLGPKLRQGDLQVPEGFYELTRFRRHTRFHRSMLVSYPNRLDRLLGSTGGAILVHGKCCTIGCIPIEDRPVAELFAIASATRRRFSRPRPAQIPIHIFPLRMTDRGMRKLSRIAGDDTRLMRFWRDLRAGYLLFERTRKLPRITVGRDRRYRVSAAGLEGTLRNRTSEAPGR